MIWSTVQPGWRWTSSAAAPATWGEAMLVPLNDAHVPSRSGTEERIEAPGAETSGFMRSDKAAGPEDENDAIEPDFVVAATAIAFAAVAGEPIEPRPQSSNEFPAAATGTTPASAAPSTAASTTFLAGSVSYSPNDMLMTSMPSRTAASMPAITSPAFSISPKSLGVLSTL